MSVLQIKGRTTRSQSEFDNFALSSNSFIYTTADVDRIENYSIELSLGDGWNENYSDSDKKLVRIDEKIKISRHGSIVVEVLEEIRVPHNRYGIVLPTGSMFLSSGIIIAAAKIEPAFHGRLKLRLFNTTNQNVYVAKGAKLASAVFFPTESTTIHNVTYRNGDISAVAPSKYYKMKKWFLQNKATWISSLVASLIVTIVGFSLNYFLYYKPILERAPQSSAGAKTQNIGAGKDGAKQ